MIKHLDPNLKDEDILYLDIETQYLITEFENGWKNPINYKNIRIGVLGICKDKKYRTFEEYNINNLLFELVEAKLIVGHNILKFDYEVLKWYFPKYVMNKIREKTFDTMLEFDTYTPEEGGWVSLDDSGQRNFNMKKNE